MVCFVVPVDHLKLRRLKLDLCDKTMVESVSCHFASSFLWIFSAVKLSHIFFHYAGHFLKLQFSRQHPKSMSRLKLRQEFNFSVWI